MDRLLRVAPATGYHQVSDSSGRDLLLTANKANETGMKRTLGLGSVTSLVVANMIGAGIFTTTGLLMADLGDPWVLLVLWAVGGVIALCGALCFGELGAAMPEAGGEYVFLSRLYHPLLGFLTGWVSFFAGFSAPIAASAIGFSEYLSRAMPALAEGSGASDLVVKKGLAILLIAAFTAIHRRGLEIGSRVQNVLTLLKVALVLGLVVFGFGFGEGSFEHLGQGRVFAFDLAGWKTLGLALMWIMFAYSGWNAAAYIGSEIREPGRNLPRALILGTLTVTVLYLAVNLLFVFAVTPEKMSGVVSVAGLAVAELFGESLDRLVSLLISFALFSSLSAFVILGPRVYYAMAKDGCFFAFAAKVHPRFGVPSNSIVVQGVIASLMVLVGSFDQILTYMGFSLGIFPLLAVAGVFKVRRLNIGSFRMPGFPVVPLVYLACGAGILVLSLLERPVESSIAVLMVLVGVPVYFAFTRGQ